MLHLWTFPLWLCLGTALDTQATPATQPAPAAPGPRIVLESASGEVQSRSPRGFDTQDPRQLNAHVVRFEGFPSKAPGPGLSDSGVIELTHGDRLYGRVRGGRAELLDVEIIGPLHVPVSVDELKSLVFPARLPNLNATTLSAPADGDRIYRRQQDGLDRIDGGVEEFSAEGVRFHSLLGSKLIPWTDIAALFIEGLEKDSDGRRLSPSVAALVPIVVDLVDHSRVRGGLKRMTGDECRLVMNGGIELVIPAAVISQVFVEDGSVAYLSTMTPAAAVDSTPFGDDLGMRWPHRVDQSVTGAPLAAGGRTYARGIGVHAPSKITWKLDGGFKSLRGRVAVDDQVLRLAARGSVVFRVHVDGVKRWESGILRGGDPPLAVPAQDLTGARELVLEVDAADNACIADRADWLDLLLVRS